VPRFSYFCCSVFSVEFVFVVSCSNLILVRSISHDALLVLFIFFSLYFLFFSFVSIFYEYAIAFVY
jgi:hypothetical protein